MKPPVAEKIPHVTDLHGDRRVDNYFWMREKSNPKVKAYLDAENAYTDAVMKLTEPLQAQLYEEIVGHIKETDLSVPYRDGDFFYYVRTEEGRQYSILCRKKGGLPAPAGLDAAEEIFLDVNELAEGHPFLGLGAVAVSDDGNLLAYSADTTGFREYTLRVKDLRTGEVYPEQMEKTGSAAWAGDNRTLFYTVEDSAKRQYRLYRHRLRATANADALIYEEKDEHFNIAVERSRSRAYLFLAAHSHTTSEWRFLSAENPSGDWHMIAPRKRDHEYDVDHHGEEFYIRTNDGGRNFRLVRTPVSNLEGWQEVVPHRAEVMLSGLAMFRDFYVLFEREGGLPQIRVTDFASGRTRRIEFPEPAYAVFAGENRDYQASAYRYNYQSLVTPRSVFDFDVSADRSRLLKQIEVPNYDAKGYVSERLWAEAGDGARIPISLVYRKGFVADGTHPMYLTGYGAYGFPLPVTFNPNLLSLLDRGFVFAMAHVRGGGEMGKPWHDDGRMMRKRNTFSDFIVVAEFLVSRRYASFERLVISGTSAGGLLIGAAVNMRPDLFRAALLRVPFVDVINTMSDRSLPLTVPEFEEWGNPANKDEYEYMKAYCPYTNLAAKAYPALLVKTSFNDSQVMYWEPAKYVAKLRTLKTDSNPLLLKVNMSAGHGGSSGRYDLLREVAFEYAFILGQIGKTQI